MDSRAWHGYALADAGLPAPRCVTASDKDARPSMNTKIPSAEYCDTPDVLEVKAEHLLRMWTSARHPVVYAGAGISTSSGISDYASNATGSKVQATKRPLTMSFINSLKPTLAHRVVTAMERRGYVWAWLQQNHDGLAQKAGFPARKVNELHGSWLDGKANPIIKMSGNLRGDLCKWMSLIEERCDFVFAVGTSLSGLLADCVAQAVADRHARGNGQGLAIITVQKTPYDGDAALRVFARIDDFMAVVARKMRLTIDKKVYPYAPAPLPVGPPKEEDWEKECHRRRLVVQS